MVNVKPFVAGAFNMEQGQEMERRVANCRPYFRRVRFRRVEIDRLGFVYYFDAYCSETGEPLRIKVDSRDNLFVMWFEGKYKLEWVSYNQVRSTQRIMLETYGRRFVIIRSKLDSLLSEMGMEPAIPPSDRVDLFLRDYTWNESELIYIYAEKYVEYEEQVDNGGDS